MVSGLSIYLFQENNSRAMQAPIFIFSLPRSGSTLLQRVLMTHNEICSVAEPWILLPQIYALKKAGLLSEYSQLTASHGINDFANNLPNGVEDYNESLGKFITDLYEKQCVNNERYFLDKTPRYYLIINEIANLFPDAKFIFLFRNPVHIFASFISTWGDQRLNKIHRNHLDLSIGFERLSQGFSDYQHRSISLKYEDFVENPKDEIDKIAEYLELEFDHKLIEDFNNQNLNGELGDPTGQKQYSLISKDSLSKWETILNSNFRKKIARGILNKINENAYDIQRYDKAAIKKK